MKIHSTLLSFVAVPAFAVTPEVTSVSMTQDASRRVTIEYSLENAPAVVTVDIQTNAADDVWASIGGANIQRLTGDVCKPVSGKSKYQIFWRPHLDWPDHMIPAGKARAVVTAWALDNTPDYMVVDLNKSYANDSDNVRYYASADFVPGGVLANDNYRKSLLLMRKILAKDVTFVQGSTVESGRTSDEASFQVTLTNNYYIGVFEVTQFQWQKITGRNPSVKQPTGTWMMGPVESVSPITIRQSATQVTGTTRSDHSYDWPKAPNPNSFLGKLRTHTGIDFDLPSESEWEYACRAGHGEGFWGDGSLILDATTDANLPGRYKGSNPGSGEFATCGSYAPNSLGLYDMHGNVLEWTLDIWTTQPWVFKGRVHAGGTGEDVYTLKGGWFGAAASDCRSAARKGMSSMYPYYYMGLRLACRAGLE